MFRLNDVSSLRDGGNKYAEVSREAHAHGRDMGPEGGSIQVPVSQDRSKALRDALLENATGLRRP